MENIFVELDDGSIEMTVHDRYGRPKPDKVYFDKEDLELVKQHQWSISEGSTAKTSYVRTMVRSGGKRSVLFIHQLLLQARKPLTVDHLDRDGLNNRRKNLRRATRHEQSVNRSQLASNTTGITGVSQSSGRLRVRIMIDGVSKHIGYFPTLQAATAARKQAEAKYWTSAL